MTTPNPTFSSPQNIRYNLTCENGATYRQLCTDKDFNIKECSKASGNYKKFNTIFCNCNSTSYESTAEDQTGNPMPTYTPNPITQQMPTNTFPPPPGKKKFYTGRYCQYSDNKTCSGNGIVDYNGNCDCRSDKSAGPVSMLSDCK